MSKEKEAPAEQGWFKGKRPAWSLLVLVLLVVLVGTMVVSCSGTAGERRAADPVEDESQVEVEKSQSGAEKSQVETEEPQARAALENPSLGSENAPVVMIEYADYQ